MWGTTNKVDSAEQCCAQCAAYQPLGADDIYCNGAPCRSPPVFADGLQDESQAVVFGVPALSMPSSW